MPRIVKRVQAPVNWIGSPGRQAPGGVGDPGPAPLGIHAARKEHHESARQETGRTRSVARRRSGSRTWHQRRADPRAEDRHLRHRSAHLRVGRVGARDHPGADGRSATNSSARWSRWDRTSSTSVPARSSAAKATWFAGAAATAWRGGGICARTRRASASIAPGAFAEYIVLPMSNIWRHNPSD